MESLGIINIWVFLLGTVLIIVLPGPNSLNVLATGISHGIKDGYRAATGVMIGDACLMLLAALGVDSVLKIYPLAFFVIQYAGAAYLTYLGLKIIFSAFFAPKNDPSPTAASRKNPFKRALLLSLSNPKAILFFISFFVQFVEPSYAHPALSFLVLGIIVELVSLTYLSLLIVAGAKLAGLARNNRTLAAIGASVTGLAFIGFGLRLAVSAVKS